MNNQPQQPSQPAQQVAPSAVLPSSTSSFVSIANPGPAPANGKVTQPIAGTPSQVAIGTPASVGNAFPGGSINLTISNGNYETQIILLKLQNNTKKIQNTTLFII